MTAEGGCFLCRAPSADHANAEGVIPFVFKNFVQLFDGLRPSLFVYYVLFYNNSMFYEHRIGDLPYPNLTNV